MSIGGCTVAELQDRMSYSEFCFWQRFEKITGPFGQDRGDWQAALIAKYLQKAINALIAVNQGGEIKDPNMQDFLLRFEVVYPKTFEEMIAEQHSSLKSFAQSFQ